jgi:hypothetical protein
VLSVRYTGFIFCKRSRKMDGDLEERGRGILYIFCRDFFSSSPRRLPGSPPICLMVVGSIYLIGLGWVGFCRRRSMELRCKLNAWTPWPCLVSLIIRYQHPRIWLSLVRQVQKSNLVFCVNVFYPSKTRLFILKETS